MIVLHGKWQSCTSLSSRSTRQWKQCGQTSGQTDKQTHKSLSLDGRRDMCVCKLLSVSLIPVVVVVVWCCGVGLAVGGRSNVEQVLGRRGGGRHGHLTSTCVFFRVLHRCGEGKRGLVMSRWLAGEVNVYNLLISVLTSDASTAVLVPSCVTLPAGCGSQAVWFLTLMRVTDTKILTCD